MSFFESRIRVVQLKQRLFVCFSAFFSTKATTRRWTIFWFCDFSVFFCRFLVSKKYTYINISLIQNHRHVLFSAFFSSCSCVSCRLKIHVIAPQYRDTVWPDAYICMKREPLVESRPRLANKKAPTLPIFLRVDKNNGAFSVSGSWRLVVKHASESSEVALCVWTKTEISCPDLSPVWTVFFFFSSRNSLGIFQISGYGASGRGCDLRFHAASWRPRRR